MRPARSDDHGWIVGDEIGPLSREPGELSCVILKIDAVLPPRLTTLDQLKDALPQRMEGMGNSKGLWRTVRQRCNRQLTPTGTASDSLGPLGAGVSRIG